MDTLFTIIPRRAVRFILVLLTLLFVVIAAGAAGATTEHTSFSLEPQFSSAVAFDVSPALREMAPLARTATLLNLGEEPVEVRPDFGPNVPDKGYSGDGALQASGLGLAAAQAEAATIPAPMMNFEGLSNEDNRAVLGFRVAPPDPIGDVSPNHYVEMINLVWAVYDKQGNKLLGPLALGTLWEGFAVEDCTDQSGDPIVIYDQLEDRWILSQFTTRFSTANFYNCVAISQTGDPTGAYYRYAFPSGEFFPDYPKYGVWTNSYLLTSRDFGLGPTGGYGISVYALEKNKMLEGNPNARAIKFFLDSAEVPIYLIGDGLLPADIDGHRRPRNRSAAPIVGTMDDGAFYGAPFDGINVFELWVQWQANPAASLELVAQLRQHLADETL